MASRFAGGCGSRVCAFPSSCSPRAMPPTTARGGRQIRLTTKEYALLEYLARNAGRVVGREEISEHVWDETFDPFTNTIEVYVNRLRRKIDEHAAKPLIHTRRGAGYMLGGPKVSSAATRATAQNAMLEGASNRAAGKKHV